MTTVLRAYRSYNFKDKNPCIDVARTAIHDSGMSYREVEEASGVSVSTLWNWFHGTTRSPNQATWMAVIRATGHDIKLGAAGESHSDGARPQARLKWAGRPAAEGGPPRRRVAQVGRGSADHVSLLGTRKTMIGVIAAISESAHCSLSHGNGPMVTSRIASNPMTAAAMALSKLVNMRASLPIG